MLAVLGWRVRCWSSGVGWIRHLLREMSDGFQASHRTGRYLYVLVWVGFLQVIKIDIWNRLSFLRILIGPGKSYVLFFREKCINIGQSIARGKLSFFLCCEKSRLYPINIDVLSGISVYNMFIINLSMIVHYFSIYFYINII